MPLQVAVFRALMLGDMLCAVPAWRALRRAWPRARITLVALPWARELAERLSCIDDFVAFPGHPGLPESECDLHALPVFLSGLQQRRFDLALQMHGSGEIVNPLVACFGAARCGGFARPGAWRPADDALFCAWPEQGHEIERLLALTDHLGAPRQGTALEFPLVDADREALRALWPAAAAGGYACVHAGSQLPSRRWPAERFAAVADALAAAGLTVVLTGSAAERPLAAAVAAAMRANAVDLSGRTTLWTLGALVEGATLLVCNDTGVSHVAAALDTPSVVVSCGSEVARWAPLDRARHRTLAAMPACRPCSHRVCPTDHACATGTRVADVLAALPV